MARMTPETLAAFLSQPIIAVLATLRRDGRPYLVPVWFLWRDDAFWLTGTTARTWCRHILRDPRVSLCIESTEPVTRYVAVDCLATPVDDDIWPLTTALARKYLGARPGATEADVEQFVATMRREPRLLFRLTPTAPPARWRAIDLTVYTGARGDRAWQRQQAGAGER